MGGAHFSWGRPISQLAGLGAEGILMFDALLECVISDFFKIKKAC